MGCGVTPCPFPHGMGHSPWPAQGDTLTVSGGDHGCLSGGHRVVVHGCICPGRREHEGGGAPQLRYLLEPPTQESLVPMGQQVPDWKVISLNIIQVSAK